MTTITETERRIRQAATWQASEIRRCQARKKVCAGADRLWCIRINYGRLKRTKNNKIIQVKGVDCYA